MATRWIVQVAIRHNPSASIVNRFPFQEMIRSSRRTLTVRQDACISFDRCWEWWLSDFDSKWIRLRVCLTPLTFMDRTHAAQNFYEIWMAVAWKCNQPHQPEKLCCRSNRGRLTIAPFLVAVLWQVEIALNFERSKIKRWCWFKEILGLMFTSVWPECIRFGPGNIIELPANCSGLILIG